MYKLNNKCEGCQMAHLVTETITGAAIEKPYYQCISDMSGECLGREKMNIEVLDNGYTIIDIDYNYVLAYKKMGEGYAHFIKDKFEFATWRHSANSGTYAGRYSYSLEDAVEDYKSRIREDGYSVDMERLNKNIELFKGAI